MSGPGKAVFLSYASQDAEAARRICEALRAAGVEVWFDLNELRGGDAWDAKIRRQIKECTLFVPGISANTDARPEGYFRLEWKLAVDRSHLLADDHPFLFPIVVGDVSEATARVPDKFRDVQWTRLRLEETPAELAARVARLLGGAAGSTRAAPHPAGPAAAGARRSPRWEWWMVFPIIGTTVGLVFLWKFFGGRPERGAPRPAMPAIVAPAAALSEARQLAERGFAMSVDRYDSTLDDFQTAEELFKRALALDPNDGEILARSAQLQLMYRNRGFDFGPARIAAGRQQAERAIRLVPDSPEALFALSLAQRYTGSPEASAASLERVLAKNPQHARALLALGVNYLLRERTDEALALFERARQQPKWAPLADYQEYLRCMHNRRFAEAEQFVRRSQAAVPSVNSAAGVALVALTWRGDYGAVAQELETLPAAMRNASRIVWVLAQLAFFRRDPEAALRALDRLPDDFIQDSWYTGPKAQLVGQAHALAGRASAARVAWEEALGVIDARLRSAPGDAAYHLSRGEILARLGRTEEALAEAKTVEEISRGPVRDWALSEMRIYALLGLRDRAVPLIERHLTSLRNWPLTPTLLKFDPLWDKLRGDPRFDALAAAPTPDAPPAAGP